MRSLLLIGAAAIALAGCQKKASDIPGWFGLFSGPDQHGRYAGVGVYSPGEGWQRIAAQAAPPETAARNTDDEAVIVVVDSQSGELRACGDLSGYCVSLNPWTRPAASAPLDLTPRPKPEAAPTAPAETSSTR